MRKYLILLLLSALSGYGQPSPWGTGNILNQTLDTLDNDIVITSHVGLSFNLNTYLKNHNYNIHIPANYTGNESFGIITFINASANGNLAASWLPVLAEKKLILIAGNNIGNPIAINTRIGTALAGLKALEQILNIDSTRRYTSGASGGGRSASHLMFCFPEIFAGMIPNCGANYLRQVDQDYETHQPNSHYEYIYPYTSAELEYVKLFNPVLSYLTAFDDFREGDIMNIYHNGAEPDGFRAKILEISGSHCATSTEQFRDGMNFLEHPFWEVAKDSFAVSGPIKGDGFKLLNATITNNELVLNSSLNSSRAYARNPLYWNDPQGAIIRASFRIDSLSIAQNTTLNFGFFDLSDTSIFSQAIGDSIISNKPSFLINYHFDSLAPKISIVLNSPKNSILADTLFSARFVDFSLGNQQLVKLFLWQNEWRIEFNSHFSPTGSNLGAGIKLLDDSRSIRIRPNANSLWDSSDYKLGTLVSLVTSRINTNTSSTPIAFNFFQLISADSTNTDVLNLPSANISKSNFSLFPNPNMGRFNLSSLNSETSTFSIFNSQGKHCLKFLHRGKSSIINMTHYEPGIYYLRSQNGKTQVKFLINTF